MKIEMTENKLVQFSDIENLYFSGQYEKAFKLCSEGAKAGNVKCQRFLGWIYYTGKGHPVDFDMSAKWFRKAIQSDDAEAMYGLAGLHYSKKEYEQALSWYDKSATGGYVPGMFRAGLMFLHGLGMQKNISLAYEKFYEAAKEGNLPAKRAYLVLLLKGYEGWVGRIKAVPALIMLTFKAFYLAYKDPNDRRLMN